MECGEQNTMSQFTITSQPPPIARPSTAARMGFLPLRCEMPQKPVGGRRPWFSSRLEGGSYFHSRKYLSSVFIVLSVFYLPRKSAPVQNARPEPVKMPTTSSGFESIHVQTRSNSNDLVSGQY